MTFFTHPLLCENMPIASVDPLIPCAIDSNYFANEKDLDLCVRILDYTLKLLRTQPLDLQVKKYVVDFRGPVYHSVGTAAIMAHEDGGVVDAELRVYGTSNLRVLRVATFHSMHLVADIDLFATKVDIFVLPLVSDWRRLIYDDA